MGPRYHRFDPVGSITNLMSPQPMVRANRLPLVAGLVLVLGAALRLPGLWTDLQLDEVWSLQNAFSAHSWFDLLRLKIDNNHHLTSMYMHALGPDTAAVVYRLLAYISGVAVIVLAWLVGSRDSPMTALVTAVLFATSAAFVFYSSEARGYTTAVCLMLVAWYCLRRYAESPRPRWLLGFAMSSIAGVMSHQTFVLFYLGAFIWCDAHTQRHHRLRDATRLTMRMFALPTVGIGVFAVIAFAGQQIGGGFPFEVPVILAQTLTLVAGGPQYTAQGCGWSPRSSAESRSRPSGRHTAWATIGALLYLTAGVIAPAIIVFLRRPPTLAPRYFLVPAA